ncbi:hypothetical protein [Georgenia sp. AZ-5]
MLVPRRLGARMRMFRLMDDARRRIDLAASREVVLRGGPRVSG